MRRRAFLTAAGAVGATALGAGTAAAGGGDDDLTAPADYPAVSTRDHFEVTWYGSVERVAGKYSYERVGDWSGYGDELLLFVHGWRNAPGEGRDAGYTAERALSEAGYDAFGAAYTWDADKGWGIDGGWYEAEEIARRNGPKLAAFLGRQAQRGVSIRLVAHSLGAVVTCSAMAALAAWGASDVVETFVLLGGAVHDDAVSATGAYGAAIADAAVSALNCYKDDDAVLEWAYSIAELDAAAGEEGVPDPEPPNLTDVDVTDEVPDHYSYPELRADGGCMDVVVRNW